MKEVHMKVDVNNLNKATRAEIIKGMIMAEEEMNDRMNPVSYARCKELQEYRKTLQDELLKRENIDAKLPLFAIIYNWKGLKEENYLYTAEELQKFDAELYEITRSNPGKWFDSTKAECAWKTWQGRMIYNYSELVGFLNGDFNDEPFDEDWYWENVEANDLYGIKSDTMKIMLNMV